MTDPGAAGRTLALAALARVLGRPAEGVRDDTPLSTIGADPVALLLWADEVETAGCRPVDAIALASAVTFGDLGGLASATMTQESADSARAAVSEETT